MKRCEVPQGYVRCPECHRGTADILSLGLQPGEVRTATLTLDKKLSKD